MNIFPTSGRTYRISEEKRSDFRYVLPKVRKMFIQYRMSDVRNPVSDEHLPDFGKNLSDLGRKTIRHPIWVSDPTESEFTLCAQVTLVTHQANSDSIGRSDPILDVRHPMNIIPTSGRTYRISSDIGSRTSDIASRTSDIRYQMNIFQTSGKNLSDLGRSPTRFRNRISDLIESEFAYRPRTESLTPPVSPRCRTQAVQSRSQLQGKSREFVGRGAFQKMELKGCVIFLIMIAFRSMIQ
jgi:hypothetical protein